MASQEIAPSTISFGLRASGRRNIIFCLCSPSDFSPLSSCPARFLKPSNCHWRKTRIVMVQANKSSNSPSCHALADIRRTH
jgi:hypothetical protein